MKNVVKVSIGHWAFTLEESAYRFLEDYLEKLKSFYRNEEQVDTAESKIGEYLAGRVKTVNQVVEESLIRESIKAENLPDFSGEEAYSDFSNGTLNDKDRAQRRLYRDPDRKVLGGVFGGLGAYFNLDPVGLRLLYSIFFLLGLFLSDTFLSGSFLFLGLVYIVLWLCIPLAKTAEEKKWMYSSHADVEVKKVANEFAGRAKDLAQEAKTAPVWTFLENFFRIFFGVIFIIVGAAGVFSWPIFIWANPFDISQLFEVLLFGNNMIMCKIFVFLCLFIPFLFLFYEGMKLLFRLNIKKIRLGLILLLIWLASFTALVISSLVVARPFISTAITTGDIVDMNYEEQSLNMTSDTLYIDIKTEDIFSGEEYVCFFDDADLFFIWQKQEKESSVVVLPKIAMWEHSANPMVRMKTFMIRRNAFDYNDREQRMMESVACENGNITIYPQKYDKNNPWAIEQLSVDVYVPRGSTVILRYGVQEIPLRKGEYLPFIGYESSLSSDCVVRSIRK